MASSHHDTDIPSSPSAPSHSQRASPPTTSSSKPRKRVIAVPASMSVIPFSPPRESHPSPPEGRTSPRASAASASSFSAPARRASHAVQAVETDMQHLQCITSDLTNREAHHHEGSSRTKSGSSSRLTPPSQGTTRDEQDDTVKKTLAADHRDSSGAEPEETFTGKAHATADVHWLADTSTSTTTGAAFLKLCYRLLLGIASACLYLVTFGRAGDLQWLPRSGERPRSPSPHKALHLKRHRSFLHDGVDTARRLADKVFLRIETELDPESESEVATPTMPTEDMHRQRVIGNARIRNRISTVPASALQKPFRVHACTWNVDQRRPPASDNIDFLRWLVGAPATTKIQDYRRLCAAPSHRRHSAELDPIAQASLSSMPSTSNLQTERSVELEACLQEAVQAFPDLLLVSLQEVDMGGVALVKESTTSSASWTDAIIEATLVASERKVQYKKVKLVQLVGLVLLVLVQAKHANYISHVRLSLTRTGPMSVLGNKGSVGMRATIYGKRFLFISAHFVAHKYNEKKRNNNYHQAIRDLRFELPLGADDEIDVLNTFEHAHFHGAFAKDSFVRGRSTWDRVIRAARFGSQRVPVGVESRLLDRHDYVFFLGDLNSRLQALPGEEIRRVIPIGDLNYLLSHDELRQGMVGGDIFDGFEEPTIRFPPTYKFDRNTDAYDTSRKYRDPAWCDRVLFRVFNLPALEAEEAVRAGHSATPTHGGLVGGSSALRAGEASVHAAPVHAGTPLHVNEPDFSLSGSTPIGTAAAAAKATLLPQQATSDVLLASCISAQSESSTHASVISPTTPNALPQPHTAQPADLESAPDRARPKSSKDGLRRDEAAAKAAAIAAGEVCGWISLEQLAKSRRSAAKEALQQGGSHEKGSKAARAQGDLGDDARTLDTHAQVPVVASTSTLASPRGPWCGEDTLRTFESTILGEDVIIGMDEQDRSASSGRERGRRERHLSLSSASTAEGEGEAAEVVGQADGVPRAERGVSLDNSFTFTSSSPSSPSSPETPPLVGQVTSSRSHSDETAPTALSPQSTTGEQDEELLASTAELGTSHGSHASLSATDATVSLGGTFRAARFGTDWSCIQRRFPTLPNTVAVEDYRSEPELRMSDHRPVSAQFVVQVMSLAPEVVSELLREAEQASSAAAAALPTMDALEL